MTAVTTNNPPATNATSFWFSVPWMLPAAPATANAMIETTSAAAASFRCERAARAVSETGGWACSSRAWLRREKNFTLVPYPTGSGSQRAESHIQPCSGTCLVAVHRDRRLDVLAVRVVDVRQVRRVAC